jgi:hypothetical protein
VKFSIGTGTIDHAGVKNLITGAKPRAIRPDSAHHASTIKAQDTSARWQVIDGDTINVAEMDPVMPRMIFI